MSGGRQTRFRRQLADSREAAARRAAPAFPEWDAARWSPVEPSQATNQDYLLAALASGERTESAHLATIGQPGEAVESRRANSSPKSAPWNCFSAGGSERSTKRQPRARSSPKSSHQRRWLTLWERRRRHWQVPECGPLALW